MSRLPLFAPVPTRFLPLQRIILPLLILGLALVSLFALTRTVMKTAEPEGGAWDLHPYWYFGHSVHAGINPYVAYAEKLALQRQHITWMGTRLRLMRWPSLS